MNNYDNQCDPVEIIDKKTGIKKVAYICKKPFAKRVQHYKENSLHFWTDLALVATILILVGVLGTLYVFNVIKHNNLVDFSVNYNAEELVNGQRIDFKIKYKNTSKNKAISDAQVIVRFPKGLVDTQIDDDRYSENTQTINLGSLQPQEEGEFSITGLLLSDLGTSEKFVFVLNYFNDLGQPQQEFTSREFVVKDSIIKTSLEIPNKIIIGSDFPSTVKITNTADYQYDNLKLKLYYPENYSTEGGDLISLASFSPKEEVSKEIIGTISQSSRGNHNFTIVVFQEYNGKDYVLGKSVVSSFLDFSKLTVKFIETQNNKSIKPGGESITKVIIENNESFDAKNLSLNFTVEGDFTNKNFLKLQYQNKAKGNKVFFKNLGNLNKGENIVQEFKVGALPFVFVTNENNKEQNIVIKAQIVYTPQDSDKPIYVNAQPISIPINTDMAVKTSAIFYTNTGDQVGVGNLPPKVDEYTAYWAVIGMRNGVNKLRNVKVTATIPDYAQYSEIYNVTLGSPIRLLNDNKTIEWYISEVEPYAGLFNKTPEARIQIGIIPHASQANQILPLLTNIKISGVDDRTGEVITSKGADITTKIFKDEKLNKVVE